MIAHLRGRLFSKQPGLSTVENGIVLMVAFTSRFSNS
jgi:hypothetical protein